MSWFHKHQWVDKSRSHPLYSKTDVLTGQELISEQVTIIHQRCADCGKWRQQIISGWPDVELPAT